MTAETSLQDQILDDLAKKMTQEIDNEVMCDLLEESGWVKVRARKTHDHADIAQWIKQNITGDVHGHMHTWAFTEPKDATAFILVWS